MRYKPEDAIILKAMHDMERLDAHTGAGSKKKNTVKN